jgi:predicted unusual protein kinase regulating ubiquinone biosynthesis (AarF/ABC1/UbiB family)
VVSEPPLNFGRLKSVGTIARSFEIWSFVFAFVFRRVFIGVKWSYKGGYTEEKRIARLERLANWLRLGLLRLGPTFIKIGQQFSTRVDVLSPQFIRELEKLQDRVPPFPTAMAKEILQSELGGPVEQFFDNFEDTPLAAASLGQVHRAQLKITGEQVIVKVQRPGLKEIFDVDLKNLRVIAKWLQKVDPKTDGAARDWVAIFDETARVLYDEVDYTNEAKNAEEFRAQFAGSDWIKVPRIYWDFTKTKTLCMEYAPAGKINDVEKIKALGIDPDRMARLAFEAYLQQVLRFGFFHADPHPGNVAVDAGDPEGLGRLVVYDYGMMGRIPTQTRDGLLDLFYATYEGQSDSAVKALMKMGVLVDTGADLTAVRRTADFFLSQFDARINAQKKARDTNKEEFEAEFKAPRTKEEKKAVRKRILTNIGEDLLVVSKDQPFRFPAEFTFVVVSIDGSKFENDATVCTDENTLSR